MNAMNEALAQGTTVDGATEDELAAVRRVLCGGGGAALGEGS